ADDQERSLARAVGIGIPVVTVAGAVVVTILTSLGPGILVCAAGALLGTITLMWASLRTLGGDAPLPVGLATTALISRDDRAVAERKRKVLLALKDLEHERDIGKIDDTDYAIVSANYRAEAKAILREIDDDAAPNRARAEQIARAHLKRHGLLVEAHDDAHDGGARVSIEPAPPTTKSAPPPPIAAIEPRPQCRKCGTSNELDAAFCKKCGTPLAPSEGDATTTPDDAETTEKQA
ncbi:MAG: zinc ribbon domain-containing protein, partial [Polyangiaceae bacterium]